MTLEEETQQLVDDIFDCNQRIYPQVRPILDNILRLITKHIKQDQKSPGDTLPSLSLLQRHANPWLVRLLNRPPDGVDESEFMDEISNLIANLCGRIATGETVTEFDFETGQIELKETSYTEAEIGFQTWGGSILMAK